MKITKVKCPTSKYDVKCPYTMKPEKIIVHNTFNDASAMSEISYMLGNNNKVSFHCAVDDYRIVQGIDFNRNTFNAGDGRNGKGNRKGIAIEICYSKSGGKRFEEAEKLAAQYIAYLLKQFGWGIDKVSKHQDYSKKYCPHRTLDRGWQRFLRMIESYMKEQKKANTTKSSFKTYHIKVTANLLNVRAGAGTNYKVVRTIKKGEKWLIRDEKNGWGKIRVGWIKLSYTKKV